MTSLKDSPKTEHQFRDGREDQILFLYKQGGAIPSPGNRGNHLTFSRAPCRRAVSSGSRALELRGNDPGSLGRRAGQPALLPGEPSRAGGGVGAVLGLWKLRYFPWFFTALWRKRCFARDSRGDFKRLVVLWTFFECWQGGFGVALGPSKIQI